MHRYRPVLVLFILSPFLAEVVFGATTLSNSAGLVPVAALYGGGVVLIRELARRRGSGWGRIALLAAAYGIIEEGLAIQSLFNPNLFNAGRVGGRALGINWIWTEWTLGYHVLWSIIIPILLTELLFPDRRNEPWLGKLGVTCMGGLYVLGTTIVALAYRFALAPDFRAPLLLNIGAGLLVIVLVALALGWPSSRIDTRSIAHSRTAPLPWLVGCMAFVVAAAWFALLMLPHMLRSGALVLVPMVAVLALAVGGATLLRWWSSGSGWTNLHQLAIACGAMPVSMLFGFLIVTSSNPIDQLGQGVASLIALALLTSLAWRLRQRNHAVLAVQHS